MDNCYAFASYTRFDVPFTVQRVGPLMLALLLVASTAWGQTLNHDAPRAAVEAGVLHIKVEADVKPSIQKTQDNGIVQMGVATIDQLNVTHNVRRVERIFRTDPRHADRHAAWGLDRWYRVYIEEGADMQSVVTAYHDDANVELAEFALKKERTADPIETAVRTQHLARQVMNDGFIPDDPLYGEQWHFHNTGQTGGTPGADISLPMAHTLETGDSEVIVQVVDSGIELAHPDIQNNLWVNPCETDDGTDTCGNGYVDDLYGYNFADNVSSPEIVDPSSEGNSHGLHVAGTIAATNNNGEGVASVAGGDGTPGSGVRLMTGLTFGSVNGGFAEALVYGADNGAVISNHSWGYTNPGVYEQAVLDAIDYFVAEAGGPDAPMQGGLVVVAAGNSNSSAAYYPGYYPPAMAVSASDHNDQKSSFSNYGDYVEIAAPSGEAYSHPVISTIHTSLGSYGGPTWVGTSMAAPHVAGVAALIASSQPGLTADQVRGRLISTADATHSSLPIGPRVNAYAALSVDTTPPSPITDLSADASAGGTTGAAVDLEWTATGESENEGQASSYDLRYSTDGPILTEADFSAAPRIAGLPVPQPTGSPESFTADGLPFNTTVHFAIKALDVVGNASDISNSPSTTTGAAPTLSLIPDSFAEELSVNASTTVSATVRNTGGASSVLSYRFPTFAATQALNRPDARANTTTPLFGARMLEKGEDPHAGEGHPIRLGAGGPDDFGYAWIDSNEPNGPVFDWVEIRDVGTELTELAGTWDDNTAIDLPFSFPFYDAAYTDAQVSVNGWINFDGYDSGGFTNREIPSTEAPSNFVTAFWDDIDMRSRGAVHTYHDASNNRFIVQWTDVEKSFDGTGTRLTFQIHLYENGAIRFQYLEMDATLNASTIGIEAPGGLDGLQVAFNTSYVEEDLAIDIAAAPALITDVQPASGSLSGGETNDVTITLDASGVTAGQYSNSLMLVTNDPDAPTTGIPFDITITSGPSEIAVDPSPLVFDPLFENETGTKPFSITNVGGDVLNVTSIASSHNDIQVDAETPLAIAFDDEPVEIPVRFTPTSVGEISGTITVESDAASGPATLTVTGEGRAAPEIATDPGAFDVSVRGGTMLERTLTVMNTGGSDLEYEAVVMSGETTTPDAVAAPFNGPTQTRLDGAAFHTAGSERAQGPLPSQAGDFVYQLDDGSSENSLGLINGGDVMWINAFQVVDRATSITSIASAWGSTGASNLSPGHPVRLLLYDDPTNNGDPSDAVLLAEVETTVQDPHTDAFTEAAIAPTEVEGVFFIAALYQNQQGAPGGQLPAPLDEDAPQGASWIVGHTTPGGFDVEDLTANNVGLGQVDALGFPGNWLLRANGGENIVAVAPGAGTVSPGGSENLTVTFNGNNEIGTYAGDVRLFSNDPLNDVLSVPFDLEITPPPEPVLVLNPDVLESVQVANQSVRVPLTVTNEGAPESMLSYSFPAFAADAAQARSGSPTNTTTRIGDTRRSSKGAPDAQAGQGHPVRLGAGGPDAFGYRWIDSNEPGGPSFQWSTITDVGEPLDLTDDFGAVPSTTVDLPFDFPFYGTLQTSIQVDNNGILFFDNPIGNYFINQEIPNADVPNDMIAPFWTDLDPDAGGTVHAYDDSDNNRFIVQFTDVPRYSTTDTYTFQTILYPDGSIRFQYLDMDGAVDEATVGIENADGTDGLQVAFNTDYVENNLAIDLAAAPDFITGVSPMSGTLGVGESETVQVTFDSEGFDTGSYESEIAISTNDPSAAPGFLPVALQVEGTAPPPSIAVSPTALDFGDVNVGESPVKTITVQNTGGLPLEGTIRLDADPPFAVASGAGSFTLDTGELREVEVAFTPESAGTFGGSIAVTHNAENAPTPVDIALSGASTSEIPVITGDITDTELAAGASATAWDLTAYFDTPPNSSGSLSFSATSSNPSIAMADVSGTTLNVTPIAVGLTTIAVTAQIEDGGAATIHFAADVNAFSIAPTRTFGNPEAETSYRLVGLAGQVDMDVAATLPGDPVHTWRAFRETGTEEATDEHLQEYDGSAAFRFAPGRGFWVLSRDAWAIDTTVDAVSLREDGTTTIPLHDGWNIISNPLDQSVAWADVQNLPANEGLNEALWQWNGNWTSSATLNSARNGDAYYVFNEEGLDELAIPHPTGGSDEDRAATVRATTATDGAETLTLVASAAPETANSSSSSVRLNDVVGQLTLGRADHTQSYRLPPDYFAPAQLYATRSEDDTPLGRLVKAYDPGSRASAGLAFDLTIEARADTEQTLYLAPDNGLHDTFAGEEILLITPDGAQHDLRRVGGGEAIPVSVGPDAVHLELLIGSEAFVDDHLAVPATVTFGPVYPNPSRGPITISVGMPEAGTAQIALYDTIGRRVARIHDGPLHRGSNNLQWQGGVLPSGMYFLRLRAEGQTFTEKIVRVR